MLRLRIAALFSLLLVAAGCGGNDLLPIVEQIPGAWMGQVSSGSGGGARTQSTHLVLGGDGRFVWTETLYGDGAGHPDLPMHRYARFGQYRLRGEILEIRTEATESASGPAWTVVERTPVQNPVWSGDQYRVTFQGEFMTLRFTTAPADEPIETTLVLQRTRPID
ncbi:MAG TPA: hypothetical protein VF665_10485 [Longimicrobium sp.]|jgi:hypothetical protein|uniref:hypothetical protein n=1 Tax=Longimicrobium sp. TaxID=2029185 RepID=UPI002ED980E8